VLRLLLVDEDVNALADTAARLRQRGFKVSLANGTQMACDRAKAARYDVIVATSDLAEGGADGIGLLDALAVELGRVPPLVLLVTDPSLPRRRDQVLASDIDAIAERVDALVHPGGEKSPASTDPASAGPPSGMFAGALARTSLVEFLRTLSAEKRTGTLSITTPNGAGELRLQDGEIVDAVYLRLEGVKAVQRLLAEREGTYAFTPRTPQVMRRITTSTAELLTGSTAQIAEARQLRSELGDLARASLFAMDQVSSGPPSSDLSPLARTVLARLRTPSSVDEVLDDVSAPDTDVLRAIGELKAAGRLRKLSHAAQRVPIAHPDQLHALRAQAARGRAPGYEGAARLVFAGTPGKLAILAHSALAIADAVGPSDPPPTVPIPHPFGSVRLGDDVSLDLVALPLVPAYAPLWPMALAGSMGVVRLDDAAAAALAETCAAAELPLLEASALVGPLDEGNAAEVASLIRAVLES
jgi:CheY-like chemotaxis protein